MAEIMYALRAIPSIIPSWEGGGGVGWGGYIKHAQSTGWCKQKVTSIT